MRIVKRLLIGFLLFIAVLVAIAFAQLFLVITRSV